MITIAFVAGVLIIFAEAQRPEFIRNLSKLCGITRNEGVCCNYSKGSCRILGQLKQIYFAITLFIEKKCL